MAAFLSMPTPCSWTQPGNAALLSIKPFVRSAFQTCQKRRRSIWTCVLHTSAAEDDVSPDVLYDDMVSDEDYVVLDGKDVGKLLDELERSGLDIFDPAGDEEFGERVLSVAEKISDEQEQRNNAVIDNQAQQKSSSSDAGEAPRIPDSVSKFASSSSAIRSDVTDSETDDRENYDGTGNMFRGMEYFKEDHLQFMPSWAKEAYLDGEHEKLEEGSRRIAQEGGSKRLHDIVEQRKKAGPRGIPDVAAGEGIYDCTVMDVAEDYHIPVEFVVDAMLEFGVPLPIEPKSSIRNKMTSEEIERLLKLITSYDAIDLAERYSDRSIKELTDDYDLDEHRLIDICKGENLYLCVGEHTRLSVVREDRVLDIALKNAPFGHQYPPLLDGLQ